MSKTHTVRLCYLYPREMSIYADRGNIAVLHNRLAWRGMRLEINECGPGQNFDPDKTDLLYLGGGQDKDQAIIASDLCNLKKESILEALRGNIPALFVCGGYQLAGKSYEFDNHEIEGLGILDITTRRGENRLTGDIWVQAEMEGRSLDILGYENHAGLTELGEGLPPLGRVVNGHGNDGKSGFEGVFRNKIIGTYIHGPLLAKNPVLADIFLKWALESRYGEIPKLQKLNDSIVELARKAAKIRTASSARSRKKALSYPRKS